MSTSGPRLSIRGVMIIIAVLAIVLGGGVWLDRLSRRSAHYQKIADDSARLETVYRNAVDHWGMKLEPIEAAARLGLPHSPSDREQFRRRRTASQDLAEAHATRRRIYERLALFPWESVPRDADPSSTANTAP